MHNETIALIVSLSRTFGFLALITLVYALILKVSPGRRRLRGSVIGALFGSGAIVSMLDPITLASGVIVDSRNIMIALAGPFGGLLSLAVATTLSIAYRCLLGGAGVLPGAIGMLLAALASCLFTVFVRRRRITLRAPHFLALGLLVNISLVTVVMLPTDLFRDNFATIVGPLVVTRVAGVFILGSILLRERRRMEMEQELRQLSSYDFLTGLPNRRSFDSHIRRYVAEARRYHRPLTLMMIDIDHFKLINDRFGHDSGDAALVQLADLLRSQVRESDFTARYGGDEFTISLPETDLRHALVLAERLLREARRLTIPNAPANSGLSISIGLAEVGVTLDQPDSLIKAADIALYEAKRQGRDRAISMRLTPETSI